MPSSVAGTVTEIKVKAGDKVTIGQGVIVLPAVDARGCGRPGAPAAEAPAAAPAASGPSFGGKTGDAKPKGSGPGELVDISRGSRPAPPPRRQPPRRPRTRVPSRPRRRRSAVSRGSSGSTSMP